MLGVFSTPLATSGGLKLISTVLNKDTIIRINYPNTVCPRGSDPIYIVIYIVTYYIKGSQLLGQTVCGADKKTRALDNF